jgi:hypothetical protein
MHHGEGHPLMRMPLRPSGRRERYAQRPAGARRTWNSSDQAATAGWEPATDANRGKVIAVAGRSTADGAQVTQWDDNGTPDHLWTLIVQ